MTRTTLIVSPSELSLLAARAAAGVGVPPGVAEDFAGAVRRIACFGVDPAVLGLSCLTALDADPTRGKIGISKRDDRIEIHGKDPASVVFVGVSLADFWRAGKAKNRLVLARSVDCPVLALGYATECAAVPGFSPLRIEWRSCCAALRGNGVVVVTAPAADALSASGTADVCFRSLDKALTSTDSPHVTEIEVATAEKKLFSEGITVDASAWAGLTDLFGRCLAPSNAESRASGAGAGLTDTD